MVRVDERAFTENRGPLQDVAKLSNVSRPVILEKRLSCLPRQTSGWPAERPADLLQKGLAQRHDVGGTLAQRRNLDVEDAEAVEEVLAKLAALDGFSQIAVGRGDDADVRLQGRVPPSRWNSRSCSTRRNFACADRLISVTSSRNSTPPDASSTWPGLAWCAPVKAPRS